MGPEILCKTQFQLTFRRVLTMLAIFDCLFIAMASATFSLPLISTYWQANIKKEANI